VGLRCSVFIAASLDGYIARPDGSIDWLTSAATAAGGEDFGYGDFIATRGVYVLSSGYPEAGKALAATITGTSSQPRKLVELLLSRGFRHAYVDGGKTIQSFLREGLIDDVTVTRIPILLGEGIPLFGSTGRDISLKHLATKSYPNGLVQSQYDVLTVQRN
jgi:dihydrofolate reductase